MKANLEKELPIYMKISEIIQLIKQQITYSNFKMKLRELFLTRLILDSLSILYFLKIDNYD